MQNPKRLIIFLALCLLCVAGVGAYFYHLQSQSVSAPTPVLTQTRQPAKSNSVPYVLYRYNGLDPHYGQLAFSELTNLSVPHFIPNLPVEVVYFAGGTGIALQCNRGAFTTCTAQLFDADFKTKFTIPLNGVPSRARVSPDGKLAAFTVFLTGHSYTSLDFSTETLILATDTGKVLLSLEKDLRVARAGQPFKEKDFNFWGVTFAPDSKRFYCTVSSNQKHYLIDADLASRNARVIHENVECPSVSPDGKHIGYKKRSIIDNRVIWQLHVLDLGSNRETSLSEKRSIDDQLEWFDNAHLLYAVSDRPEGSSATTDIWKINADGTALPEIFLHKAYSPSVVR